MSSAGRATRLQTVLFLYYFGAVGYGWQGMNPGSERLLRYHLRISF